MHDPKFLHWLAEKRHKRKLVKIKKDKLKEVLLKKKERDDGRKLARAFKKMRPPSLFMRLLKKRFKKQGERVPLAIKMWAKEPLPYM